ncbi:MAG: chloride channel protein [Planctomycetes bacterium]|nr:chloride channel protein [Planctomycetota bacterium]
MTSQTKRLAIRGLRLRQRISAGIAKIGLPEEYLLILVSILIGAATGVFAHWFFWLIEFVKEVAFGHEGHPGLYAGRVWMLIVLPTVGALAVGHITYFFAREAKGHGVPEVMDAIYRKRGEIRPRVAMAKSIASALTIGSGGSAGTEGPIIQIGAALGSGVGKFLQIDQRNMGVVVACGVSAGIAAIFNAPIAGVMFALEIFLRDFSFRTFSPVVFSSVISCSVMHGIRADDTAIFEVQVLRDGGYLFAGAELPLFLVLGILAALAAVLFIRALYFTEDLADRLAIPDALKPALGAVALGLLGVGAVLYTSSDRMPDFFGNGYPAIEQALGENVHSLAIGGLVALFFLKLIATCLTLGSGGSGGVFAPSLLMGTSLGAAFGMGMQKIGLIDATSVNAYALVGMAAVVAGTTHAPLTAIVMVYEITREPKVILPVMFAAIIATAGAQLMLRDSIYTLKLRRRGVRIGTATDLTILRRITVKDVQHQPVYFVHSEDPLQVLIDRAGETDATDFVVVDEQSVYQGMALGSDVHTALLQPEAVSLLVVGDLLRPNVPTVRPNETLDVVLDKFSRSDTTALPVTREEDDLRVESLISRRDVMRRYQEELNRQ